MLIQKVLTPVVVCLCMVFAARSAVAQPKPPFALPPKPPFGEKPPAPPEMLKKLIEDLGSSDDEDRLKAAEKLRDAAAIGADIAAIALTKALGDKSEHVRFAALYALEGIGPDAQRALPAVRELAANSKSPYERALAAWVATQIAADRSTLATLISGLAKSLGSDNEAVANQAAQALSEMGSGAEPELLKVLSGPSSRASVLALNALGSVGARSAVPEINKRLSSNSVALRTAAAQALGDIGPAAQSAVPKLQQLIVNDTSATVRARAADTLGRIGVSSPEVTNALSAATSDKDASVARAAIQSLIELNVDSDVIISLMPKLLADERASVVTQAAVALAEQGKAAMPVVIKALEDKDQRFFALLIISDLGPEAKETAPLLAKLLGDAKAAEKRDILLALARIGPGAAESVPQIVPELSSSEMAVRNAATFAIGSIGVESAKAEAAITANLKSDDKLLEMTSAWALAKLNPKDPIAGLRAMRVLGAGMASKDPAMQQAAAQFLADLKPGPDKLPQLLGNIVEAFRSDNPAVKQSALDAIESLLGDSDPGRFLSGVLNVKPTRPLAALAVQRIGAKASSATPALATALSDSRPDVRLEVAMALAAIGDPADAAVPALVTALSDESKDVQRAAAFALGSIGPKATAAVEPLQKMLADSDNAGKPVAAWALAFIAPTGADAAKVVLPQLIQGLESRKATQRRASAEALGNLGPLAASSLAKLKYAAHDPNRAVRAAARKAIKAVQTPES